MNYLFKISVIIPCYNAEQFLDLALETLEHQWDDKSFEMIFINDCSTDDTINKLQEFCNRHPNNTQLIDKKTNEGVGQARNDGLSIARGEWITFLDADDALVDDSLRGMGEFFLSDNIDILSFRTYIVNETELQNKIKKASQLQFSHDMIEWEGSGKDFFTKYLTNTCWMFCFKRQLIDKYNIKFKRMSYLEDSLFIMDNILHDDVRVRRVTCRLHYWIRRNNDVNSLSSISKNKKRSNRMIEDTVKALGYMQEAKNRTSELHVANRIEWKQCDSGNVIIPLLLRCDMKVKDVLHLIKQLKSWNVYPYKNTKDKKNLFYNTLFRFPLLINTIRPIFNLTK